MAEGGRPNQRSFRDSYSAASGDAEESFCDPCKIDGKHIAVEGFCPICNEYLCKACLGVHRRQKITRAHVTLDKNQLPSGQDSATNQDICVDVCKTHHPDIIRFFCTAHDVPGCGDCVTLDHTNCQKVRVQDISEGFQKSKEFNDIEQHLQQIYQQLNDTERELDNNLKNLDTTYNALLRKIASVRKEINDYLDEIQRKITNEAAKIKKQDEAELKTLKAENEAMKLEIEGTFKTLNDSNVNVNTLFVTMKQAKHRLATMEKAIDQINQSQQLQYEFTVSDQIEQIVSAKTPLGKLSRTALPQKTYRKKTKKQDQRTRQRTPTIDTKATYNRTINVKCKGDKDCRIRDSTLLGTDKLVVTDYDNYSVKLVDLSNNTVISHYSTTRRPWGVTAISTNMIAVTLPDDDKIQVFTVTSTFTLEREIKVSKGCYGIAYKDGKLAVSYENPGRVEILDTQGKVLHKIQPRGDILQKPYYITFGHDNDTVIVSDYDTNKVSTITYSGQVIRTYTHDTLRYPGGVVITADGVLFVCSWNYGCIHVVSPDFKKSKIIHRDSHGVSPQSITYCQISNTLYISNTQPLVFGLQNNKIHVYDLKV